MATTTFSQLMVFAALAFVGHAARLPTKPDGPIVHTKYGDVRGMYVEEGAIFLGLPFGVPPLGELRWKPPRTYNKSWAPEVRDGTVPGPACRRNECGPKFNDYQHICNRDKARTQSEDCLYLNVFVPRSVLNSTVRLPVMCWFHGGAYRSGTGAALIYDGRILANKTTSIVVTTNYRLAAFGYLVTGEGDDDARGNYGTLDQIEALKWVQQNIADFGGDKDKVTIFGQSAGSDSAAVLLTSSRAADLFHQAIMLSVPFSITHKTQVEAIRLGSDFTKLANCSVGDMKCLRSKSADEILQAQEGVGNYIANPFRLLELFLQWGPTVDGDVLPRQTVDSFAKGQFQRKPLIIGTVAEEAILFIYSALSKTMSKVELDGAILAFLHGKGPAAVREYNPPQTSDYRPFLSQVVTDWVFECPTRNVIRNTVQDGESDVWLYVFDHTFSSSFKTFWLEQPFCLGHVCHGEDIPFVFQTPKLINLSFTPDEQVMADTMAYHYGNFAHTGDPNKPSPYVYTTGLKSPLNWPKYNEGNQFPNMNFTTPQNVIVQDYNKEKCDFWDKENIYSGTN